MMCGRHSSIRNPLSAVLVLVLATGGWWVTAGDGDARAADDSARAVAICCAWGNKLGDGVLTYSVTGGDPTVLSILRGAVEAWDDALPELTEPRQLGVRALGWRGDGNWPRDVVPSRS